MSLDLKCCVLTKNALRNTLLMIGFVRFHDKKCFLTINYWNRRSQKRQRGQGIGDITRISVPCDVYISIRAICESSFRKTWGSKSCNVDFRFTSFNNQLRDFYAFLKKKGKSPIYDECQCSQHRFWPWHKKACDYDSNITPELQSLLPFYVILGFPNA